MRGLNLLLVYFWVLTGNVCGFTNKTSEVDIVQMDHEMATKITALLQQNFVKDFSWDDPELMGMLSRAADEPQSAVSRLLARQPKPFIAKRALLDGTFFGDKIGPLLTFPQCIGCATKADNAVWTIDDFTIGFFMNARIVGLSQLKDTCVFYSQRTAPNMVPDGLSKPATKWACLNGLKTIWMMWPYNTAGDSQNGNYWYMFDNKDPNKRNWLQNVYDADVEWRKHNTFTNTLPEQGPINIFFSRMSAAMAFSCSGRVYMMTDNPQSLPRGGIWPLVEFPSLQEQHAFGLVTEAVAIPFDQDPWNLIEDVSGSSDQKRWRILDISATASAYQRDLHKDWSQGNWTSYLDENGNPRSHLKTSFKERSAAAFRKRMRGIHESKLDTRALEERDSCLGGQPYEPPGHDFFGRGW